MPLARPTTRFYVRLQGDQIGGFGEYLKIPEAWERDYAELRSHNETTGLVAGTLLILTILGDAGFVL